MSVSGPSMHEMALARIPVALTITDPTLDDNPLVFVNPAFTRLTGYSAGMCLGRNCRFLQGEDTDPRAVAAIGSALRNRTAVSVEVLNYKADGTPFLNRVDIAPLHDASGSLRYFVGVQRAAEIGSSNLMCDGPDEALREMHHRVKNHLSMVVGMIRMQARAGNAGSAENYATLARRVETLQFLYDEMTVGRAGPAAGSDVSLGAYVSRIAFAIADLDGRDSVRLTLDLDDVRAPVDVAAQVGLLVSELLTNAYRHAFVGQRDGRIEVRLRAQGDAAVRLQVSDDGIGLRGVRWPDGGGLGGRIVRSLVTGLDAGLAVTSPGRGTVFTVEMAWDRFSGAGPAATGGLAAGWRSAGPGALEGEA